MIHRSFRVFLVTALCMLLFSNLAHAKEDKYLYNQGVVLAKSGDIDFAFMHFNRLINSYPESKLANKSLFAVGEYYYLINNYSKAITSFYQFINNHPQSEAKLFALMYILKMA